MPPTLETKRLILRPFSLDDAAGVKRLAGDREIASTTLNIPHPYMDGMAEAWINTHKENYEEGLGVVFAITLKETGNLVGAIGLTIQKEHKRAVLGYWMGKAYWNMGYTTEAAAEVVDYAFKDLELNRISASHLSRNPASGRVMQKIGMSYEGCFRQHVRKWGDYEDLMYYAILRDDYDSGGS